MKKYIIFITVATFVSLGISAQVKLASQPVKMAKMGNLKLEQKWIKIADVAASPVTRSTKTMAPNAGTGTIDGDYILNADNYEGDFTECSQFTIWSSTGQITLDQYEGEPTFDYNVVLNDFSYEGAVVYGHYDTSKRTIYIPIQQIAYNATYKEIYISGGYRSGTDNLRYGKPIYLIVNDDGTMDIDEDIDPEDPDDNATSGWVDFLPNYVDPDTGEEGGIWNYGFDIQVMKSNGTMYYMATGSGFGFSSWTETSSRVYIEDYGSEWVVNNFLGLTPVSVTLNVDGKCSVALGQKMYDYDQDEPYGYFRLVGVSLDGDYINRDYTKTAFNGFYGDGYCEFYKQVYKEAWTDDAGSHEAGYYYVDNDPDYVRYVSVATANDADGAAYVFGYASNLRINMDGAAMYYKLTYVVDGIVYKTYNLKYGTVITPEPDPIRTGYTFSGWSWIPSTMPAEDVIITGSFTPNKYKLIYKVDGVVYKSYDVEYGTIITPEPNPEREGYTFSGWSWIPTRMPAEDVIVTGTFTVNKYKLTYKVDGEVYKSYDVEYGTHITPEPDPVREGYTFSGWSEIPTTMPAHNVTVTGSFTKGQYKLTYMVDGEIYKVFNYDYNSPITPEPDPIRTGYTFSGWSWIPTTMPAEDVIVTGTFTINKYKVTYIVDGNIFAIQDLEYGSTIVPPATDSNGNAISWNSHPTTMPAYDITIYGSYTTTIDAINNVECKIKYYTLDGQPIEQPRKGVNIVRMSDGTVKKVVIK